MRASLGLGSTAEDVDRLVAALREIAADRPRYVPEHDEHLRVEAGRFAA